MSLRRLPLAVGLATLAVGAALAYTGTVVLPEGPVRFLMFVAGALAALGIGLLDLLARSAADPDAGALAEPGDRGGVRTPGDAVDDRLSALGGDDRREREKLRARAEAVAVDVLTRRLGCPPAEARDRLAAGTWTDDPRAGALFDPDATPWGTRVRALVAGDTVFERNFRAATAELSRVADGGEVPDRDDAGAPSGGDAADGADPSGSDAPGRAQSAGGDGGSDGADRGGDEGADQGGDNLDRGGDEGDDGSRWTSGSTDPGEDSARVDGGGRR